MKRKYLMFMAGDDGGGSGAATADPESFVEGLETIEATQGSQQTTTTTPAKDDDLRQALAQLAGTVNTLATPKTESKAPTQDEINEFWAVYNPTKSKPDFFDKTFLRYLPADMDPAERKAAAEEVQAYFNDMHQGMMKQAVRAAQVLMQQELEKVRGEFSPVNDYVSQQRAEQTRSRFYGGYPALAEKTAEGKPRFQNIIDATARKISESKKQFSSEDEYFKALAEDAAETIKNVLPTFDLGKPNAGKPNAVTSPRLPRTSVGGTGGTVGGGGTPTKKSGDDSDEISWV